MRQQRRKACNSAPTPKLATYLHTPRQDMKQHATHAGLIRRDPIWSLKTTHAVIAFASSICPFHAGRSHRFFHNGSILLSCKHKHLNQKFFSASPTTSTWAPSRSGRRVLFANRYWSKSPDACVKPNRPSRVIRPAPTDPPKLIGPIWQGQTGRPQRAGLQSTTDLYPTHTA